MTVCQHERPYNPIGEVWARQLLSSPRPGSSEAHLVKFSLDSLPVLEQLLPPLIESPVKDREEVESLGGEDGFAPFRRRDGEVDTVREGHVSAG